MPLARNVLLRSSNMGSGGAPIDGENLFYLHNRSNRAGLVAVCLTGSHVILNKPRICALIGEGVAALLAAALAAREEQHGTRVNTRPRDCSTPSLES